MRIAIFIKSTTFHKGFGGLETQNKILSEGLVKGHGYDITIFSPKNNENLEDKELNGVNYKFVDAKFKNSSLKESLLNPNVKKFWYKKSAEAFYKNHAIKPFDLIISQSSAGLGLIREKKNHHLPVISICHGSILNEFKTLLMRKKTPKLLLKIAKDFEYTYRTYLTTQKEFISKSDHVVAVSEFVKNNIMAETQVSPTYIDVIYNGVVEYEDAVVYNKSLDIIKIVYAGRIEEEKGINELVSIFRSLQKKTIKKINLILCGDGPLLAEIKENNVDLILAGDLIIKGKLPSEDVRKVLEISHIFALPTKRIEGFPMTLPEAMYAELAIVAMDAGGIKEGVFNEENGYLINFGDWLGFEDKLLLLIENNDLRDKKADMSYFFALNRFTASYMVAEYVLMFKRICQKDNQP